MSKTALRAIVAPPKKEVIEHVEDLLRIAKNGELQGLVYVCVYRGNFVNHGYTDCGNRMRVIGELEQIKWKLLRLGA